MLYRLRMSVKSVSDALDVMTVTPGLPAKARLAGVWIALLLKHAGLWPTATFRVSWRAATGSRLSARVGDVSELKVIREVFVNGEYAFPTDTDPEIIVDAGSHAGFSVLYFHDRFPGARIIAIEADPATFRRLCDNIRHLPRVTPVHAALTDTPGTATIYSSSENWASSLTPGWKRDDGHEVPAVTLEEIVAEHGLERIDLLKMDIEGAERAVLRSPAIATVARLAFEFHQEHSDETLWDLLERLPDHRLVGFAGNSKVHPIVTLVADDDTPPVAATATLAAELAL